MDNQRNTSEGLPIVTDAVIEVLERDLDVRLKEGRESEKKFNEELVARIKDQNPRYYEMIFEGAQTAANASSENERDIYNMYTIGLVKGYEALRRQAEINQLE